ncbi:hypothetical protein ACWGIV_11265 [Streptomyces sp. NPDC054844]
MVLNQPQAGEPQPVSDQDHGTSIRAAARWLISAFAAIGALLVAGLQLQSVGTITEPLRLTIALGTVFLALLATGWVIIYASRVLIAPAMTWDDLVDRETSALTVRVQASSVHAIGSHTDADELLSELVAATQMRPAPLTSPRELRRELRTARQTLAQSETDRNRERVQVMEATAAACLNHSNSWQSRCRYKSLIKVLIPAGCLIALCVVGFAWASSPTDEPPKVTKPLPVQVYLQGAAKELKAAGLQASCAGMALEGTAVSGPLNEPEVSTEPRPGCAAARFIVTPSLGIAVLRN